MAEKRQEWWAAVDREWDRLRANALPRFLKPEELLEVDRAYFDRDAEGLHKWLSEVWWRAPDRPEIHLIPGWDEFCDLCSEF